MIISTAAAQRRALTILVLTLLLGAARFSVETFVPNVVEPSFGIDRILCAIYEHAFYARAEEKPAEAAPPKEEGGKKAKAPKKEEKGPVAGVLGLPAEIAPYKVVVLPLDMRVAAQYGEMLAELRTQLTDQGLQYKVDESGASIGRRYARADELERRVADVRLLHPREPAVPRVRRVALQQLAVVRRRAGHDLGLPHDAPAVCGGDGRRGERHRD